MTELRISLHRYEQIVELANEGIWTLDTEDRTEYINERGAAILGYSPQEMLGRLPTDFVVPESLEDGRRRLQEIKAGEAESFEYRMQRKDGSTVWVSVSAKLLFDRNGNYEGAVGVFSDITDRRRWEEELNHSQQMLRFVLNCIPDRVFWKDRELNYLGCNWNLARDAGLEDPSDIVGKNDHQLAWRDSADAYQADDRSVIDSGVPKLNFEERQIQSDGDVRWLRTSKVPLRDADGAIIGVLGTYEDITDRKRAEKELDDYSRQLERSNEEAQQFAYIASHDLQEPLRTVVMYLSLLSKKFGGELDPQAREFMSIALDGAERMRTLVSDLLEYTRVETKAQEFAAVDMSSVVGEVMNDLRLAISEANAEIVIGDLPTVMADEVQMKQVLTNLVSNAIKYRGEARPRIEISAVTYGDEFVFTVKDNGIGIESSYHHNIFQMFQRVHPGDEYPGTGMGLAISKKIVERHNGRIWVESEPGKGSTFFFTLPCLDA
jgi:PAS domain S-box-containing protein